MAYGSYGAFGPASFFTNLDLSTLIYALFFLLVLWIAFKSLSKIFPYQKSIALVLSMALALLAVWILSKANFNFENLLYNIGFSREFLLKFIPWILLIAIILIIWIFSIGTCFMVLGSIFLGLGLMDLVYERGLSIVLGIIFLIIGFFLRHRKKIKIPKIKLPDVDLRGPRLAVVVGGRRYKYPPLRRPYLTLEPGKMTRISVENIGSKDLVWRIITERNLRVDKTSGKLSSRNADSIKVTSDPSGGTKYLIVKAKGRLGKISRQKITIFIKPGRIIPPEPDPIKPDPIKPDPVDPDPVKPKRKKGEASLDVIIGGKNIQGNRTELDLSNTESTIIYIKNGGTGGTLGWRAHSNHGLDLSKTHGKLTKGSTHEIKVRVKSRTGNKYASVIIKGRGGGNTEGRAERGRVLITFKLK